MTDHHKLKNLQVRINKINSEIDVKLEEVKEANSAASILLSKRKSLEDQVKKIQESGKEVTMSEHAMLRYIERVLGFDLSQITDAVVTKDFSKSVKSIGDCKIPIKNGARAVVKNNVIVTIET